MSTTTSTQVLPRLLHRLVTAGGTTKDDDTNNVLKICSILRQQKSLHKDEIESVTHALLILLDAPSEAHRLGALKCLLSLVKRDDDVCDVVAKSAPRFESILLTHLISSSDNRRLAMELSLCLLRHDGKLFQSEDLLNKLLESSEKEPDIYVKLLGALGDIVWSHIGSRINTAVALLVSDRTSSEAALSAVRKGWGARASLPLSLSLDLSRYVTRTHTPTKHTHSTHSIPTQVRKMCDDQPQLVAKNLKSGMPTVISLLSSSQPKLSEIALVLASTCVSQKEARPHMLRELPALLRLLSSYSADVSSAAFSLLQRLEDLDTEMFWDAVKKRETTKRLMLSKLLHSISRTSSSELLNFVLKWTKRFGKNDEACVRKAVPVLMKLFEKDVKSSETVLDCLDLMGPDKILASVLTVEATVKLCLDAFQNKTNIEKALKILTLVRDCDNFVACLMKDNGINTLVEACKDDKNNDKAVLNIFDVISKENDEVVSMNSVEIMKRSLETHEISLNIIQRLTRSVKLRKNLIEECPDLLNVLTDMLKSGKRTNVLLETLRRVVMLNNAKKNISTNLVEQILTLCTKQNEGAMNVLYVLCASQARTMRNYVNKILDLVLKTKSNCMIRSLHCVASGWVLKDASKGKEFLKLLSGRHEMFRDFIVSLAVRESWFSIFLSCESMMVTLKKNISWSRIALEALGVNDVPDIPDIPKKKTVPSPSYNYTAPKTEKSVVATPPPYVNLPSTNTPSTNTPSTTIKRDILPPPPLPETTATATTTTKTTKAIPPPSFDFSKVSSEQWGSKKKETIKVTNDESSPWGKKKRKQQDSTTPSKLHQDSSSSSSSTPEMRHVQNNWGSSSKKKWGSASNVVDDDDNKKNAWKLPDLTRTRTDDWAKTTSKATEVTTSRTMGASWGKPRSSDTTMNTRMTKNNMTNQGPRWGQPQPRPRPQPPRPQFPSHQQEFLPSQQQFRPRPQQFGPRPQQFGPRPQQFGSRPQQFGPRPQQFGPRPQQLEPRPQQQQQFERRQPTPKPPRVQRQESMAQQDKIVAVQAMTGHPDNKCRDALERTNWDVKLAAEYIIRKDRETTEERRRASRTSSFASISTKEEGEREETRTRRPSSGLELKELEGELLKQSKYWKSWRRRYIVLQNGKLVSYQTKEDKLSNSSPRDVFELNSNSTVETCDGKDGAFSFVVKIPGTSNTRMIRNFDKTVSFAADTKDSRDLWMKAIGNAIKSGGSSSSSSSSQSIDPMLIQELSKMGFSAEQAREALIETNGNVDAAVDKLLSGESSSSKPVPPKRSVSLNMNLDDNERNRITQSRLSEDEQLKAAIQASLQDVRGGTNNSSSNQFENSSREKMFEIKLPYDAIPGQRMHVEAPNGRKYMITVPTPIPASRKIHMSYE